MVHNTDKKLASRTGRFHLLKMMTVTMFVSSLLIALTSCTLLTKHLEKTTNFSQHLARVEKNIRDEDWENARTSLEDAENVWKKLRPIMQIDIDHDYIKDIEDGFTKLDGYVETQDKSNSLAAVLLIEETWKNIDSL